MDIGHFENFNHYNNFYVVEITINETKQCFICTHSRPVLNFCKTSVLYFIYLNIY